LPQFDERGRIVNVSSIASFGTCGFVGGLARPDCYYGYSLLSKHSNADRLTTYAFRCIIRLGHYLAQTRGMHLHITTPQLARRADGTTSLDLFSCFVDSSHGNGENGTSHGGFLIASCAPPLARPLPPALAERTTAPVVSPAPDSAGLAITSERASLAPARLAIHARAPAPARLTRRAC
jgi:hypothetical protein